LEVALLPIILISAMVKESVKIVPSVSFNLKPSNTLYELVLSNKPTSYVSKELNEARINSELSLTPYKSTDFV
jgi:hypothetical protein